MRPGACAWQGRPCDQCPAICEGFVVCCCCYCRSSLTLPRPFAAQFFLEARGVKPDSKQAHNTPSRNRGRKPPKQNKNKAYVGCCQRQHSCGAYSMYLCLFACLFPAAMCTTQGACMVPSVRQHLGFGVGHSMYVLRSRLHTAGTDTPTAGCTRAAACLGRHGGYRGEAASD